MKHNLFKLNSEFAPSGDQPNAIRKLVDGINTGAQSQTLLGVTGSGKTFTIANVIEKVQKPTLVIAHNKTLAAQLYNEFKELFPSNAVEYFISYYDYYQPEAYIPRTDTYIEKSATINDEIDRLRHNTTRSLYERNDVIVVASVSCIYGLGLPENYFKGTVTGKTKKMVSEIADFTYIVTNSETEAFIAELNLIKEYNPKYNILLKDDKSYPYI